MLFVASTKRHCWGEAIPFPERLKERLFGDIPRYHAIQDLVMCRHCGLMRLRTANQIRNHFCIRFYQPGGPKGFTLLSRDPTPVCDRDGLPANDLPRFLRG